MKTLNFVHVDFDSIRKSVAKFLKADKASGIKKAWYFHHIALNQTQAIDTRQMYNDYVELYASQGITHYKTIIPNKDAIRRAGAVDVKLHVFRKEGHIMQKANNDSGDFVIDEVAIAFDYLPSDYESCVAEVIFAHNPATVKKSKKSKR